MMGTKIHSSATHSFILHGIIVGGSTHICSLVGGSMRTSSLETWFICLSVIFMHTLAKVLLRNPTIVGETSDQTYTPWVN